MLCMHTCTEEMLPQSQSSIIICVVPSACAHDVHAVSCKLKVKTHSYPGGCMWFSGVWVRTHMHVRTSRCEKACACACARLRAGNEVVQSLIAAREAECMSRQDLHVKFPWTKMLNRAVCGQSKTRVQRDCDIHQSLVHVANIAVDFADIEKALKGIDALIITTSAVPKMVGLPKAPSCSGTCMDASSLLSLPPCLIGASNGSLHLCGFNTLARGCSCVHLYLQMATHIWDVLIV